MSRPRWARGAMALTMVGLVAACAPLPRLDAVPEAQTTAATVPGIPNARYWPDFDLEPLAREVIAQIEAERAELARSGLRPDQLPRAEMLVISGGGDSGAFGAGVLVGWTAHGTRPEFKLVTGISTGALIAPFAFLGPDYDDVLRSVATTLTPDAVVRQRNVLFGLAADAMGDSAPLAELIAQHVTASVLEAVAAQHARGRMLLIGTADLDAGRPVIWNMGAIAASREPGALELFRKIMLASSSIPALVPPVMIDVELAGRRHQEMHVDGGVIAQLFLYPSRSLEAVQRILGAPLERERRVYVIRNGALQPEWLATPRRTLSVAKQSIAALIHAQGISDLGRLYRTACADGVDFNLAHIGPEFHHDRGEEFDPRYMRQLFDHGHALASAGYPWHKALPAGAGEACQATASERP